MTAVTGADAARPVPEGLECFPFPLTEDTYRYSTNVEPAGKPVRTAVGGWGTRIIDIDRHYDAELRERAGILRRDPSRMALAPHMGPAAWDALMYCLECLAREYPDRMSLVRDGRRFAWSNRLQDLRIDGVVGDDDSVPGGPLAFLAGQIQEDVALLDKREDALWLDGGVVTFASNWSMAFDMGMRFLEIHGPVPRVHEERVITRAHDFLMRMQPGEAYRRTNWSMTVDRRLDVSTETYPEWGSSRTEVLTDPRLPERLHLRIEVQHLIALPHTGAVLFLIRTYLESLERIARVPQWRARLHAVLTELPQDMADYKGLARYRPRLVQWLGGENAARR